MILVYVFLGYICVAALVYRRARLVSGMYISKTNADQRKWYGLLFVITFILMILFVGLRHETIGLDTWNYANHYVSVKQYGGLAEFWTSMRARGYREIGYWWLLYLLGKLGVSDCGVRLIFAIMSCTPIAVLIYNKSNSFMLSLFIYLAFGQYAFAFSAIRQSIAIGFIALSILVIDKSIFKAGLCIVVAAMFHITAIVFLPMLILSRLKVNKWSLLFFSVLSILLYFCRDVIMDLLKENYVRQYDGIRVGGTLFALFLVATALLQYFYGYKLISNSKSTESIHFWICAMTATVYMFARTSPVYLRLALYYQIILVITIPNMLRRIINPLQRCIGYWGYIAVGIYFFFDQVCYYYQITPYRFFWQ